MEQAKAEEKQRQGKRRKKAVMIIIDEEDQSSIMLASMLILDSSIFFSLGFALYLLTDLAVSPAHRVFFRFACVVPIVPLGGCGFPDQEV